MKIIILNENYKQEIKHLYEYISENLENKNWFLPKTEQEIENLFDKDLCYLIGLEDKGKIVATSALYLNKEAFQDLTSLLNLKNQNTAEIGRCVVLPEYRGNDFMYKLNKHLLKIAKEKSITTIVATAHPDNVASNKSLQKLGMQNVKQMYRCKNYLRNVYYFELK